MFDAGDSTVAEIAAVFGVSRATIYRHRSRNDESRPGARAGDHAALA
jgi:hypothetical protein